MVDLSLGMECPSWPDRRHSSLCLGEVFRNLRVSHTVLQGGVVVIFKTKDSTWCWWVCWPEAAALIKSPGRLKRATLFWQLFSEILEACWVEVSEKNWSLSCFFDLAFHLVRHNISLSYLQLFFFAIFWAETAWVPGDDLHDDSAWKQWKFQRVNEVNR